jgi:hypothetical protein
MNGYSDYGIKFKLIENHPTCIDINLKVKNNWKKSRSKLKTRPN